MGVAYTPGLRVAARALIRQERRLPLRGQVLVEQAQSVEAEQVIARAEMPGNLHTVRAAQMLRVEPHELEAHLLKRLGETVETGEVVAQTRGLWGLFKSELRAPISGTLDEVSAASGHIRIREAPRHIEVRAHIAGRVAEVIEGEGAVVEAHGSLVQGIFGVGGERRGRLCVLAQGPDDIIHRADITDCEGGVIVGGAGADADAIQAAAQAGAVGMVVAAVRDQALRDYVGFDIGVAITGQEPVPMTLILTEGFGELPMANRTWDLLLSLEGQLASIDGATQIRAGVMRPEVIVTGQRSEDEVAESEQVLAVGSRVRVIRAPHFGALGHVAALPAELTEIETESAVRIALVGLDSGEEVRVPRANLEIIQE